MDLVHLRKPSNSRSIGPRASAQPTASSHFSGGGTPSHAANRRLGRRRGAQQWQNQRPPARRASCLKLRNTRNTLVVEPFVLDLRVMAEIDRQTKLLIGCPRVVDRLSPALVGQVLDRLDFQNDLFEIWKLGSYLLYDPRFRNGHDESAAGTAILGLLLQYLLCEVPR